MKFKYLLSTAALFVAVAPPFVAAQAARPRATTSLATSHDALNRQVRIPYERFTLPNGLRVIVHTDRKAPVVAVSVWYDVGSKQEPAGKTGFAHLFEHLMFNGSENADEDFFKPMQEVGATGMNGSTWYDRTNYYETVPTGALEKTLWLESDRMGHLLGAVTQAKLDNQRAVVQNEKRQGDNKLFGLVSYRQTAALFPAGHPYGHDTIGSMADLDSASLEDVHDWFRQHYGPNNAILVLAGDIDRATAQQLVTRYFGDIPRGPAAIPVTAPVPTLPARKDETITDRISATRLYRTWVVPGRNDPSNVPLAIGASVLGGLASSRLDNALVRREKLAVQVSASLQRFTQTSQFEVVADVKPGTDPGLVARRLDAIIAELVARGPSAAEVRRAVTQNAAAKVKSLESVGGKAGMLAEGLLYSDDPETFAKDLAAYAAATPASVQAALGQWLSRPAYALTVHPGARAAYEEAKHAAATQVDADAAAPLARVKRMPAPAVAEIAALRFPEVSRARLSNGIEVVYAQRSAVPVTAVSLSFDAGIASDPIDRQGMTALMTGLLQEGTASLDSIAIAERQEELGASIGAGSSLDRTGVSLSALSANLAPSLDLFAEVALRPAFAPQEVERVRAQQLAAIAADATNPQVMASRALTPALYGKGHPYARIGKGTEESVKAITRADLVAFHQAWLRPDKAKLFVVSDRSLGELQPLLEARFGNWRAEGLAGVKSIDAAIPSPRPRVILIDRKDSPQSQILAGHVLDVRGADDTLDLDAAAQVVGGSFLSRINMDIRETKGWSYGVRAGLTQAQGRLSYRISAPVEAGKTGPAIAAMLEDYRTFLTDKGVTAEELDRTKNGNIRELPGAFETANSVLGAMEENDLLGRPDDYYARLAGRVAGQTANGLDAAARKHIQPRRLTWVVVGDAASVRPQLDALGLGEVEVFADGEQRGS